MEGGGCTEWIFMTLPHSDACFVAAYPASGVAHPAGRHAATDPVVQRAAVPFPVRKGKKLSNTDWVSKSDPEAKIAKMKDGTTHLAYKPEHAVDLDTGAVVAAELHPADEGDTTTLSKTLAKAEANLEAVDAAPTSEDPAECVADKGYHSRAVLRALNDSPWKTRIAAPKQTGFSRWHGDEAARRAVTNNRARLKSGVAREAFKLRDRVPARGVRALRSTRLPAGRAGTFRLPRWAA